MKTSISRSTLCMAITLFIILPSFGQTRWVGTTSTNWATASNWTSGVPLATTDAIIGDASFTGPFQPAISATATAKSLTIGGLTSQLTVASTLSVRGDINIISEGTLINGSASISLTGNWYNSGTYTTTSANSLVTFNGITQSLNGSAVTTFRKLTINTGSTVTLNTNVISAGLSGIITVIGTLNPNESPIYQVTSENLTINSSAILKVTAPVFTDNYNISASLLISAGSIVDYAATGTDQVVSSNFSYSTLRITGTGIKSLVADLPLLRSTSSTVGYISVLSGTFNLASYTANRGTTLAGGSFTISNGAFLKISGAGTFPTGYTTYTLGLTSTVDYNGSDQAVAAKTYGNLVLTSAAGDVVKTMPATAFTVAGSFTSAIGLGTSVSYTAASNISVTGSFNIGASTTFSGATFSHAVTGNFNNNGTFTPGTCTLTLRGTGSLISGNLVQNFYNLTVTASNVTAPAITTINIAGNLATSGSGAFTQPSPGILTMTGTTKTITGSNIVFNDLSITGVVTTSSTARVAGNLNVSNSLIASTGTITMSGAGKVVTNTGTLTLRGLLISGSVTTASNFTIASSLNTSGTFTATAGTVTFTGSPLLSGTVALFNININGTYLYLASNSVLGIANTFSITAGSLRATSYLPNTVNYNGTAAQTVRSATYNNLILSNGNTKTAAGNITVNNALTVASSTTFSAVSYIISIYGNWVNNGSFTAGTSSVQFRGATNVFITGASTFNNLTVNKSLGSYSVTLVNNVTAATVTMTLGSLYTVSNTLTITTSRSGNGIILGTITRTHAFVASTAYTFEGPYNTITFASGVTGVTSVTVNVTVGNVVDFPYGGAIGRTYNITVPSGTYNATVRLHYEDAELNGNDESIMQMWKYNGASWALSGKTSNSSTLNYVDKSGLTNITNRWSLTDDGRVLSWNGSVSSNWSTDANWTLVHGVSSSAPTLTDIAEIGTTTFTNQPIITTSASVKSITFGSVQAVTLTLNTGGMLTAYGNINGTWSSNNVHAINANDQNISVNGDLSLSDNTNGHAINLNIGTATINVLGSVTQSGNADINFTGAGTLNIGKDFIYSSGLFTPGTGLVKYTGSVSQVVGGVSYNNLTIIKTAGTIATLTNAASVAGNLVITTGELEIKNSFTVTGSVTISGSSILDADAVVMNVGGSWTKASAAIFNAGTGSVNFNGSGNQTISEGTFNILSFNKPAGTAVLSGNDTVNGNLSLLSGTLNLSTFTLNQSSFGDVFTIADGATLLVSGSNNFPTNFTTYNIGTNSLVRYDGTVAQNVGDVTYGNIIFSNGGAAAKTFIGSCNINGNLSINSGATLDGGTNTLTILGDWNNSGTFTASTSTIIFNGGVIGANKLINGATTFYNFITNGSYALTPGSNLIFLGDFEVTGFLESGFSNKTFYGNLTLSGVASDDGISTFMGTRTQYLFFTGTFYSPYYSSSVVFKGTVAPVSQSTSSPMFINLEISNTSPMGTLTDVGITVLGTFLLSPGCTWNGADLHHTFMGPFTNNGTILSSGTLTFAQGPPLTWAPSTTIHIGSGSNFQSTGTVEFGGASELIIDGAPSSFKNVIISNTNPAGITPVSNWDMTGNFSINSNAIFNAGSYSHAVGGNLESDGTLNGATSTFTMSSPAGELNGSPGTVFHNLTLTGNITANSDFNVKGDFMNNGTFDGSLGALIMTGSNPSVIGGSTTPSGIAQLTISKTNDAVVSTSVDINSITALLINSGILFISDYSLFQDAAGGALIIFAGATLKLGGTNTVPAFSGYGLDPQSTVDYAGTMQTLSNGPVYGNLNISAAGNKTATSFLPLTITGNFSLTAGNFIANNNTHKIEGNWIMAGGTFNNANSVIRFNGSSDQVIQTLAPFNSVNVNKASGIITLGSDITINAILSFTKGIIKTDNYKVVLPSTGTLTGAAQNTGWINGNLQKTVGTGSNVSRTFEIGGINYYSRATVLFASVTTEGNLIASAVDTEHPQIGFSGINTSLDINRYWALTNSGIVFTTAASTFYWVASDVDAGAATANFKTGLYNGSAWAFPSYAAASSTSVQATGLTSFGSFAIGERLSVVTWTGAAGTADWFTPVNWYGGVPTATIATVIPATLEPGRVFPIISSGTGMVAALTIQSSASLMVTNGTLQIKGPIVNNGTFDAGNGTVEMNGTAPQTIPANAFANNGILNLIINNNVTLAGQNTITGTLTMGSTNKTLETGGFLTLKSTALSTAMVAPLPVDATGAATSFISGNVIVERFIPAKRAWRLLTSPLSNTGAIYDSWQNGGIYVPGKGIFITGPNPSEANGLDMSPQNSSSLKTFNAATQTFNIVSNTKMANLSGTTGNAANTGYFAFVRGDRNLANLNLGSHNSTTLASTGILQTGKQIFTASGNYGSYTMMGNPYAAPVDFNAVNRTHLIKRFYTWDATLNNLGAYVVLDDIDGDGLFSRSNPSSLQDKNIQSGQAFFVQTDTAGTAALTYEESSKTSIITNSGFRPFGLVMSLEMNLSLLEPDNSTIAADAALAEYNEAYCACVNLQDATKFNNTNETFSLLRNGYSLAIERRPVINQHDTLFLRLTQSTQRNYQLTFKANNLAQVNLTAFLEDKYTGLATPVNLEGTTTFNFTINADIPSAARDRFRVVFKPAEVLPVTYTDVQAWEEGNHIVIKWKVENELNIRKYEVEKSTDGANFVKINSYSVAAGNGTAATYNFNDMHPVKGDNFYRIRNIDNDGTSAYSKTVTVSMGNGPGGVTVYPNPVIAGVINLQLNNMRTGKYGIRLLNTLGQVMLTKELNHTGGNANEKITLSKELAKGVYNLEIKGPGKQTTIIRVVNQ